MKNAYKIYYQKIVQYNLITKFSYKTFFQVPDLNKIILHLSFQKDKYYKNKLISIYLLLYILTNQQPVLTKSSVNNLMLKVKKGDIIGCKVTLRKQQMYNMLTKIIWMGIFNQNKEFVINEKQTCLNFNLSNYFDFIECEKEYLKWKNLPSINISIQFSLIKFPFELYSILNEMLIPYLTIKYNLKHTNKIKMVFKSLTQKKLTI